MSKLTLNRGANDKVGQLVQNLKTEINLRGDELASASHTKDLVSFESLDQTRASNIQDHFSNVVSTLKDSIRNISLEGFDDAVASSGASLEAGAIAAMAVGAPADYARAGYNNQARASGANMTVVDAATSGAYGNMDYREAVAMEAFDDRELRDHLPFSIAFNIFASRQDAFSEMFFPTTVVTPDMAGLDVAVNVMTVFNEVRHGISGRPNDWKQRNLIDAVVDANILADETTRLVPVRLEDDSNAAMFVDEALVAPSFLKVAGVSVPTAPLAIGQTIDLLGISQYPALMGSGVMDNTDAIDARIMLEAIYIQPDAAGATAGNEDVIKFVTGRLPRNTFVKTVEGKQTEMGLQFSTQDLVVNKDSKAVDGSTVDEFAGIVSGDYTVRLGVTITGSADLELGTVSVLASKVTVVEIRDNAGNEVATNAGAGQAIVNALADAKVIGYDLKANRTNSNRRTRGHLLNTTQYVERYTIPLGSPLSIPSPLTSNRDSDDLKALIAAARIRNTNNAVTALLNYSESLAAYTKGPRRADGRVAQIQGIGRYLVKPFFEVHELDMLKAINTRASHEKAADVQAVLVNAIRDVAYRALRDSNLQAAMDQITGGSGEKPKLLVGTDQVLVRHLQVAGDTRTFGDWFDKFEIQASMDSRMANKIVISFGRDNPAGPDPLQCGAHAWIPELTSVVNVSRNGATHKEAMVQPRSLHVLLLPVMAIIDVKNLSYALAEKIDAPHVGDAIDHEWLDGVTP